MPFENQFDIEARQYQDPDVVRMVAEVQAHYVDIYGGPDDAAVEPEEFTLPNGQFLVGLLDGAPVATAGWRRLLPAVLGVDDDRPAAELKRMYVSPEARRRGLARILLAEVERSARMAGIERLVLNTGPHQDPAVALYRAEGYAPCPPFGYYAEFGSALFFDKVLTG